MYKISDNLDTFLNHRANTETFEDINIKAFPSISLNHDFAFKLNDSLTQEFFSYKFPKSIGASQQVDVKPQLSPPVEEATIKPQKAIEKDARAMGINISKKNCKLISD